MSNKNINLTNSEWSVLECLWEEAPLTVMQMVKKLTQSVGWAKSTSTTTISRMDAKGLIYHENGGRAKLYYPAVKREDAVLSETKSFINKVYQGSVGMMMSAIAQQEEMTKAEIDELYVILKQAEEAKK